MTTVEAFGGCWNYLSIGEETKPSTGSLAAVAVTACGRSLSTIVLEISSAKRCCKP